MLLQNALLQTAVDPLEAPAARVGESESQGRLSSPGGGVDAPPPNDWDAHFAEREGERLAERRRLCWALVAALLVHGVLLAITLPQWVRESEFAAPVRTAFVIEQVRFKPPPPRAAEATPPPQEKVKRIPIPDPTPDDPEPLIELRELVIEPPLAELEGDFLGIPDAPPTVGPTSVDGQLPLEVGGEVQAPVRIHSPSPPYTEEARLARVQGVVLLRTVIDSAGDVVDVEVVKGLPEGLTESAVETVEQWKFRPATKNGEPVPVFFFLTISFHVQ